MGRPEDQGRGAVRAVGGAVGAHVQHEHVEQRAIRDLAIDPSGFRRRLAHRHELVKRAAAARGEAEDALVGIAVPARWHAGAPVVGHLVIVPLREHRHRGIERTQVRVEQVVFVVAAKVGERLRHARLLLGHDVLPGLAVRQLAFGGEHAVGVDVVARVNEEIGLVAQHGRIGAHAAARLVDAPGSGVARPHEGNRAPLGRCRAEATYLRLARDSGEGVILEADPVEDVLPRGQPFDQRLGGEVGLRQRVHGDGAADGLEAVSYTHLDVYKRQRQCGDAERPRVREHGWPAAGARRYEAEDRRPDRDGSAERQAHRRPSHRAEERVRQGVPERRTRRRPRRSRWPWRTGRARRRKRLGFEQRLVELFERR